MSTNDLTRLLIVFVRDPKKIRIKHSTYINPTNGLIPYMARELNLPAVIFLGNKDLVLPVTTFITFVMNVGRAIILYIAAMIGVPKDLFEAAEMDGASELTVLYKIMLPIVKPGIGALFILNLVQVWNDYLWQLVVVQENNVKTLMVGIATLMQDLNPNFAYKMAGATVAAIPMLIIFVLFQSYFTRGLSMGAVKE